MKCLGASARSGRCLLALGLLLWLGTACGDAGDASLREVRALQGRGLYAESLKALAPLRESASPPPEVELLYGKALIETKRPNLAVAPLRRAAQAPEHAREAGLLLASALLASDSSEEALQEIDRVLDLAPGDAEAWELRARANLAQRHYKESLADIERAIEAAPERASYQVFRSLVLLSLGQTEPAEAALHAAEQSMQGVDPQPVNLLATACVTHARLALARSDQARAREEFASCVERYPGSPMVVQEAVSYYDGVGEPEKASDVLRGAIEAWPERVRYLREFAERLRERAGAAEAERFLLARVESKPSVATWAALAEHYTVTGDYRAAASAFHKALTLVSDDGGVTQRNLRLGYADSLIQARDFDEARRVTEQIKEPGYADLLNGRILLLEGDAAGALALLEKGIRVWPNNAVARFLAGQAAERVGDFERAAREYQAAVHADPVATDANLALAELYESQGKLGPAHDAARRHARTHRDDPRGYALGMRVAHRLGRTERVDAIAKRMAAVPGQRGRAVAERASLTAADDGPKAAVRAIESAGLDLTDPSNAAALRVLAEQLVAQGAKKQALARVDVALAAHPDVAVLHTLRGAILERSGSDPAAVHEAYSRALALDASDAEALSGLARESAARGDVEAALGFYGRAAQADPEDVASLLELADLSRSLGRLDAAQQALERALYRNPREAAAAAQLAALLLDRDTDLDRALDLAQRAVQFGADPEAGHLLEAVRARRAAEAPASTPAT
jgi:tetratricopeptide (TPR) repeat protein